MKKHPSHFCPVDDLMLAFQFEGHVMEGIYIKYFIYYYFKVFISFYKSVYNPTCM